MYDPKKHAQQKKKIRLHQNLKLCASNVIIKKVKKDNQPIEWKKIFANHSCDKKLVPRIK